MDTCIHARREDGKNSVCVCSAGPVEAWWEVLKCLER